MIYGVFRQKTSTWSKTHAQLVHTKISEDFPGIDRIYWVNNQGWQKLALHGNQSEENGHIYGA